MDESGPQSAQSSGEPGDETVPDETDEADTEEGLTYAEAGVDIAESEAATAALAAALEIDETGFAGTFTLEDRTFGLTTDGVGTKLLVADAVGDHSTIGIDCVAMNVNDLLATGLNPLAFVDYLALEFPEESLTAQIGEGLAEGCRRAGCALVGGETAVLPEVVNGFDLAGAAVGAAPTSKVFTGAAEPGDRLVGFASSGVHSNGLTLARTAVSREFDYEDPFPFDSESTVGETLLEPTRIYTDLLPGFRTHDVRAAAHITGGGWTNLTRMGDHRYVVTDPFEPHDIFELIARAGDVTAEEMHRTFNMGTGFVVAVPPATVEDFVAETEGRAIGRVAEGEGIAIRGLELSLK